MRRITTLDLYSLFYASKAQKPSIFTDTGVLTIEVGMSGQS